jgi:hypothetical protein
MTPDERLQYLHWWILHWGSRRCVPATLVCDRRMKRRPLSADGCLSNLHRTWVYTSVRYMVNSPFKRGSRASLTLNALT